MKHVVKFMRVRKGALPPVQAHPGDAGYDIFVSSIMPVEGQPDMVKIGCGLAFDLSEVGFADFRARSSVFKHRLTLTNGVGTVDKGYRGEVYGIFRSIDKESTIFAHDERYAQLVFPQIAPDDEIEFVEVDELAPSERGANGFGSTGTGKIAAEDKAKQAMDDFRNTVKSWPTERLTAEINSDAMWSKDKMDILMDELDRRNPKCDACKA